jgi:hypothetical protein
MPTVTEDASHFVLSIKKGTNRPIGLIHSGLYAIPTKWPTILVAISPNLSDRCDNRNPVEEKHSLIPAMLFCAFVAQKQIAQGLRPATRTNR